MKKPRVCWLEVFASFKADFLGFWDRSAAAVVADLQVCIYDNRIAQPKPLEPIAASRSPALLKV
jgi:hypothetical protein